MKDLVKKAQSFITFDVPLRIGYIQTLFATTHHQQQSIIPYWGVASTRQKLIAAYWYFHVTGHFATLFGLPALLTGLFSDSFNVLDLAAVFTVGLVSFMVLLFFHYLPDFTGNFLPKLEAVTNAYHSEQHQQIIARLREKIVLQQQQFQQQIVTATRLAEQQQEETKKCRQSQLSNLALTLIYYVLAKTSGMPDLQGNDLTAHRLMKLYGIDPGSIRANIELITGTGDRRKNLSDRKRTEIVNRIDEACQFFEEQGFTAGILLLKTLEISIVGN